MLSINVIVVKSCSLICFFFVKTNLFLPLLLNYYDKLSQKKLKYMRLNYDTDKT